MDDLAAQIAAANAHTDAALHQAAEVLAPEPDPAACLAPLEVPALMPAALVDAATRRGPSARGRRADAHRRHRKKVRRVLEQLERQHRRLLAEASSPSTDQIREEHPWEPLKTPTR
jgi:hypothetical protein